jgi:hypothetical protein
LILEDLGSFESSRNHGLYGEKGLKESRKGYLPQGMGFPYSFPNLVLLFGIRKEVTKKGQLARTQSILGKPECDILIFEGHGEEVDTLLEKREIQAIETSSLLKSI